MRALVVDPSSPAGFALAEVPDPVPGPGQVLVQVQAISAIDRDLRYAPARLGAGGIWGFDAAGVVARAAADGSGPTVGTRIVAFLSRPGTWAQLLAADIADVGIAPDGVDAGASTAMAIPAVSALQVMRRFGTLLNRRVLITGASGAVGWYGIQLASLAGAHVIALVRDRRRAPGLAALGAGEIVTTLAEVTAPVHAVIDLVGGPTLVQAFDLLAEGGSVQAVGAISEQPSLFRPDQIVGPRRRIEGFWGSWPVSADLQELMGLVAAGRLRQQDAWRGSWREIIEVARALTSGQISGKAILSLS